jgi:hypothetical protein
MVNFTRVEKGVKLQKEEYGPEGFCSLLIVSSVLWYVGATSHKYRCDSQLFQLPSSAKVKKSGVIPPLRHMSSWRSRGTGEQSRSPPSRLSLPHYSSQTLTKFFL